MIDVCKYEKIGEYRNGEMVWISPKNENVVYLIMFGDESYIGSSINIRNRFLSFVSHLKRGKCESKKVQNVFDWNDRFDLYALEFTDRGNLRKMEEFYINSMHPSLNTKTRADYLYRDSRPLSPRHREKNIKEQMRLKRKNGRNTSEDIANELGITKRGSLANMIGGNPTVETLQKIADAIGASRGEFFADEGEPCDVPRPEREPLMQQTIDHGGKQLRITIDELE